MTAKKPKSQLQKVGRKTVMTDDVLRKLEETAALDASVPEMCFYAGIHQDTYYDYCKKNPKFSERIKDLRSRPILLARQRIIKGIQESYGNAMDYATRKAKAEFSSKQEVDITSAGEKIEGVDIVAMAARIAEELKQQKT